MASETDKPAPKRVSGLYSVEPLAGELNPNHSDALPEIQARSLRQNFAVGYCLAASLAPLIWGMPR